MRPSGTEIFRVVTPPSCPRSICSDPPRPTVTTSAPSSEKRAPPSSGRSHLNARNRYGFPGPVAAFRSCVCVMVWVVAIPRRFYGSWTTQCTPRSGVQAVLRKHADLPGAYHHLVARLELQRLESRAWNLDFDDARIGVRLDLQPRRRTDHQDAPHGRWETGAGGQAGLDVQIVGPGVGDRLDARFDFLGVQREVVLTDLQHVAFHPAVIDAPVEEVDGPEEAVRERRRGMVVDLVGAAHLLDLSFVHQHYAVSHLQRLFLVVSDEDGGDVQVVVQPAQPPPQVLAHLGVERAERLVQQQDLGLDGQRASERDSLALAPRELRRVAVRKPVELDQAQQVVHPRLDLLARRPRPSRPDPETEGHVLEDRHLPEERVVLEAEAHLALAGAASRGLLAVDEDFTGIGRGQASDDAQQSGLAAAARAEQRHQLTLADLERDPVQGDEAAEALADVAKPDAHGFTQWGDADSATDPACRRATRHSTAVLSASVTSASSASSEATANAAAKLYSL